VVKGSLPAGLSVINGILTGTPAPTRKSSFTLQIADQSGASMSKSLRMKVFTALTIATKTLANGRVGRAYLGKLTARKGKPPYTWSLAVGTLPAGLTLDPATGRITGTPTAADSVNLTFQVSDGLGVAVQKSFALNIQ
jgi:hypothetical protein